MKKFVRLFLVFSLLCVMLSTTVSANTFTDIKGLWYEQTVINAAEKGWTTGYPDGSFKGYNNITHAEFITLINSVFNYTLQDNYKNPFKDVNESDWYYDSIMIAYSNKLLPISHAHDFSSSFCNLCKNKYKDIELFKPNDKITREDAMTIISKISNFEVDSVDVLVPVDSYYLSDYAYMPVLQLYSHRIVKGDEKGKINPKDNLTRAEALTIIERTYNYLNDLLPDFIEPQFEIKLNKYGKTQLYLSNPNDLYKYWYKITYESPKELNYYQITNVISHEIENINLLNNTGISINQLYHPGKEMEMHIIDIWNFYHGYKGYIPKAGEKVTIKVTIYNPEKTISKDYYFDYIA